MLTFKPKTAKCAVCKGEYMRLRPLMKVCGPSCAITHAKAQNERKAAKDQAKERKVIREKLAAMETKPQLTRKAQAAFNTFIRARDAGKPCISCGRPLSNEPNTYDAGHYRSVGSAPHMRFVEDNCFGQCKHCNQYLSGNHVEYRKGLIARIGLEAVEAIEADQTVRKYTREGLIEIARHYRAEARRLKGEA
jgi:hypothetical protein